MSFWRKPQYCSTMKSFSVLLVFILAAFPAVAQTDTIVAPADTNAPATQPGTNGIAVQTNTNPVAAPMGTNAAAVPAGMSALDPVGLHGTNAAALPVGMNAAMRAMSLEDCIQEALKHNLDVQISRYTPQIQLFTVRAGYGAYDPTFDFTAQHKRNDQGPEFQNGVPEPASTSDQNTFTPDLSGSLPWGMTYDFNGTVTHNKNIDFSLVNTNLFSGTNYQNSSGSAGLTLTQPLLKNFWIDQPRLTIRLAKNLLKYDEQGLRLQLNNSITAVENAYYELIYAQENVKVQQEALVLAQTQLDQDRQRVQIGTLAQLDVQQDESQVATSKANLIAAQYTLANDQNTLKNLLTDQYAHWHDTDIQPTETITNAPLKLFDLQDSWSKGMTERPDLLQSRLNVEAQGIQLKFDNNQLYPELNLNGSYGYNGAGVQYNDVFGQIANQDRPTYYYGAELKVPLSNVGARNTYKADKVTLQQLLLKLKQFEQNIMVQIDNAVKNAQSTYESVGATRQARIYAEAALDAEQKKYAVGKSTTFTVLQLQNTLTTARSQEIRALANYYEALSNLALQEGSTLERNRINVEAK
jgi:outer membrane protein TolC